MRCVTRGVTAQGSCDFQPRGEEDRDWCPGTAPKALGAPILTDGAANGAHLEGGAVEGADGTGSRSSQRFLQGRRWRNSQGAATLPEIKHWDFTRNLQTALEMIQEQSQPAQHFWEVS